MVGCGDALTVNAKERAMCDAKVSELSGRKAVGEEAGYHVNNHNGTKSVRLIYQETSDFPGMQCDLVEGKVSSIVRFEAVFPAKGQKI